MRGGAHATYNNPDRMGTEQSQAARTIASVTARAAAGEKLVFLVAAVAANGVIGRHGRLPWHLPEDLKHFKRLTAGHPVIMGRKTWEAIGRPLPQRDNIVVTRQPGYHAPGARVAASFGEALALSRDDKAAFVIGGSELYRAALPHAAGLVITEIHRNYEGDASFPEFDRRIWQETQRESRVAGDGTRFDFVLYERVR